MKRTIDVSRQVRGPYALARGLLEIYPEGIVRPAFDELRVGLGGATTVGRVVSLEVGRLERTCSHVTLPLDWKAATHPALFPTMEGELQLSDAGGGKTTVRFIGRYEPPLGVVGAFGDALAGHRLARETVSSFLTEVVDNLEAAIAKHADAPHRPTRDQEREQPSTGSANR